MARRVFFSFHYQRDIWRVNQIRNVPEVVGTAAAGFAGASLWEEAKKKGDETIKRMIREALKNTSVTVVCIGQKTAGRKSSTTRSSSPLSGVMGWSAYRFTTWRITKGKPTTWA